MAPSPGDDGSETSVAVRSSFGPKTMDAAMLARTTRRTISRMLTPVRGMPNEAALMMTTDEAAAPTIGTTAMRTAGSASSLGRNRTSARPGASDEEAEREQLLRPEGERDEAFDGDDRKGGPGPYASSPPRREGNTRRCGRRRLRGTHVYAFFRESVSQRARPRAPRRPATTSATTMPGWSASTGDATPARSAGPLSKLAAATTVGASDRGGLLGVFRLRPCGLDHDPFPQLILRDPLRSSALARGAR